MGKRSQIGEINKKTYLKPPSWEQIEEFINELGVPHTQFERFYGIPYNVLTQVKSGKRNLPASFWHYIYLKIKPAYGSGFLEDYSKKQLKNRIKPLTKKLTQEKDEAHNRLTKIT